MTRILILLVAGAALTLLPGDAPAGCHAVHVQKQAVVAYQPVYNSPYLYQVGTGLQLRAAIEVAKEELRAEMRAMQLNSPGNPESSPERLPITAEVDRWQLVRSKCKACHDTNQAAKEAFDLSGDLETLTCEQRLNAIRQVVDGSMPKGKPLSPEELGDLIGAFSGSEKVGQ